MGDLSLKSSMKKYKISTIKPNGTRQVCCSITAPNRVEALKIFKTKLPVGKYEIERYGGNYYMGSAQGEKWIVEKILKKGRCKNG